MEQKKAEEKDLMRIVIGGREIPMFLSTLELIDIEEAISCTVGQLRDEVFGVRVDEDEETGKETISFTLTKDKEKLKKFGTLVRILGNAGLEESGLEGDLTDRWILRGMKPSLILGYAIAVMSVINEGMRMENRKEENGPVDVTLEEENRKKEPGN
jgi:hypothetical protein